MKREDIMQDCPEEFEGKLKDFIDYIEQKFVEIRDKLEKISLYDIDNIPDAFDIACKISDDLY